MKTPRIRKPFRVVRVVTPPQYVTHGVDPRLVLEIWPNGTIYIREHGRRVRREITAANVYVRCIMRDIAKLPRRRNRRG